MVAIAATAADAGPAQTIPSTTEPNSPSTTPVTSAPAPAPSEQFDYLQSRIDDLQSDRNLLLVPLSILVGLLAAGGAVGIVTTFRGERRTGQAHELLVAGETSAQIRTEQSHASFLQASQQTLTLVNDTLELAREASERAARTLQLKAEQSLAELDTQAEEVIEEALVGNFKRLVLEPALRSELIEVATEVNSIEGYLQLQGVELTPACLFVKGMDRHLRQEPRVAVRSLRKAAQETRSNDLAALAQFWIGYESNNLGKYKEALQVFRSAADKLGTNSPLHYELRRIQTESRFFDLAEQATAEGQEPRLPVVDGVRKTLEDLLIEVPDNDDQFLSVRRSIHVTIANVLVWAAGPGHVWLRQDRHPTYDQTLLQEAVEHYDEPNAGAGMWARFGKLEAHYQATGQTDISAYEAIMRECDQQLSGRVEARSLSNLHASRMIAQVRAGKSIVEIDPTYRDLQTSLSHVDRTMTIFSEFEKRNLAWKDFEREARDFYDRSRDAAEQGMASPPSRGQIATAAAAGKDETRQ